MKNCYSGVILAISILSSMGGCSFENNRPYYKEIEVKETMNPSVYIDPAIDLSSKQIIPIIIEFHTKPAKIAVIEAEAKGIPLTLEEAQKHVKESHLIFQKELHELFDLAQIPYKVRHNYTTALNGVSMELPAQEITRLAESSAVISRISLDRKIKLEPPIQPFKQR